MLTPADLPTALEHPWALPLLLVVGCVIGGFVIEAALRRREGRGVE